MDLQHVVTDMALNDEAILVGYTKIRKEEPVMVLAFPFSDKWLLNHPFYITRRFNEELITSWRLQKRICKVIRKEGYTAEIKTPLSVFGDFRPLAVAAGLGEWGKNGLVVNQKYGSHLLLAAIFTNAPFESTPLDAQGLGTKDCTNCNQCIQACPANAFENQRFSAKRCIPYALRGCSECVRACQGEPVRPVYH